jgi:hypothetical protein
MNVLRGERRESVGLVELELQDSAVEFILPRPAEKADLTLPVRVVGLNRRWTAGLFQKEGYVRGGYTDGRNVFWEMGLDFDGNGHIPVHLDYAPRTHMIAGHPVVADERGK